MPPQMVGPIPPMAMVRGKNSRANTATASQMSSLQRSGGVNNAPNPRAANYRNNIRNSNDPGQFSRGQAAGPYQMRNSQGSLQTNPNSLNNSQAYNNPPAQMNRLPAAGANPGMGILRRDISPSRSYQPKVNNSGISPSRPVDTYDNLKPYGRGIQQPAGRLPNGGRWQIRYAQAGGSGDIDLIKNERNRMFQDIKRRQYRGNDLRPAPSPIEMDMQAQGMRRGGLAASQGRLRGRSASPGRKMQLTVLEDMPNRGNKRKLNTPGKPKKMKKSKTPGAQKRNMAIHYESNVPEQPSFRPNKGPANGPAPAQNGRVGKFNPYN